MILYFGLTVSKKNLVIALILLVIIYVAYIVFFHPKETKPKTIILVGDSMTEILGENATEIKDFLKQHYPRKQINIINYGFGATNIESLPDRVERDTTRGGKLYPAILNQDFDLIIIESFGNNPLSHYPLEEGLKKQTQILDDVVRRIKETHPDSIIVFSATIAPHKDRYGEGAVVLETKEREKWASERAAYIRNHINYADSHAIPLINIYQKSLDENGGGNIDYINTNDFIHPSTTGIIFISYEIAEFIYKNRLI